MELIVVMVIIGVLAAFAVPCYSTMMIHGTAQAAQNNLITIYRAQKDYYFSNGTYCTSNNGVCTSLNTGTNSINKTLSLNINDNNFSYLCANDTTGFICQAQSYSDPHLVLTVTNSQLVNNPIGGPGPGASASASLSASLSASASASQPNNPICTSDISVYCP